MEFSGIKSISSKQESRPRSKTISSFQLIALTFIIGLGLNMLNLPALLVMDGGRDGWITMLIITVFDCIALYLTLTLMDRLKKCDSNNKAFKVFKIIFGIVMTVWAAAKLLLLIGEARMFFGKTVFDNLDWLVFLGLLCALGAILGGGGGRGLGRLAELLIPIAIITVIILVITSFAGDIDFSDVLPILHDNPSAFKSPLKYALWVGNYPILFSFFRNVEFKKHTKLLSVSAAAGSGLLATALTFALSATYGSITQLIYYGNNAADMNQFVSNYNFGRIDLIVFTVWSLILIVEIGLFQYGCVEGISAVVGKSHPWLYSWITAIVIYILMNLLVPCDVRLFEFATRYSSAATAAIQFLLPLVGALACFIGWLISVKRKGARNDEK